MSTLIGRAFSILSLGAAWVLASAGCTTLKIPPYPGGPSSEAAQAQQEDGLQVTVDPFFDKQRMREYFKLSPFSDGLVILHLSITNANPTNSYHVQKQTFRLLPIQGSELGAADRVDTGTAAGEATALVGASLASVVGMFAGAQILSDEMLVRKNLVDKEMPDQTLSPGRTMQGFVYYQLPGKRPNANGAVLLFTVENASTHEKVAMRFPLHVSKTRSNSTAPKST